MDRQTIESDLQQGGWLLDVRSPEEYALGHFKGARLIPHTHIAEAILPEDKETPIYLHCKMGPRADIAAAILQSKGYTRVTNLGGLSEMEDLGFTYDKD